MLQEDKHLRQHVGYDGKVSDSSGGSRGRKDRTPGWRKEENRGFAAQDAAKVGQGQCVIKGRHWHCYRRGWYLKIMWTRRKILLPNVARQKIKSEYTVYIGMKSTGHRGICFSTNGEAEDVNHFNIGMWEKEFVFLAGQWRTSWSAVNRSNLRPSPRSPFYFSDICGFTQLSAASSPMEVTALKLYSF